MRRLALRLGRRLLGGLVMIWVVSTFTFFIVHALPGDPVQVQYETLLARGVPPDQAQHQVAVMYGFVPHTSVWHQYGDYIFGLAHGDFGQSISYTGVGVGHIVLAAAPWTVVLVLTGILASFLVGVSLGVLAAVRRSSRIGDLLSVSGSLLHGIPQFVLALLLLYIFSTQLAIMPYGAPYDASYSPGLNWPFMQSVISHAILPVAAYALSSYGGWLLTMKSSVISVLGDDFILAAELRGLRGITVMRYVARNAILPLFTILALSIGFMFGGSVFIESIFDYQGLGQMLLSSISARDYPLMAGAFLLITAAVIVANILAELVYTVIDPRVRRQA